MIKRYEHTQVGYLIIGAMAATMGIIGATLLYYDLRVRKQG